MSNNIYWNWIRPAPTGNCRSRKTPFPIYFNPVQDYNQQGGAMNPSFTTNSQTWGTCGDSVSYTDGTFPTVTISYNTPS
ncbi:MAG: hypothetical protein JRN52_01420 [Nitrososphaerota archaeon]|nr:hypothetical protein [Nitrososphaerota archaeon]